MKKLLLITVLYGCAVTHGLAQPKLDEIPSANFGGVVFEDRNANGIMDAGERGIAGVEISDQVNIAITDASGHYQLPAASNYGIVFISTPGGYKSNGSFWKAIDKSGTINFPLSKIPASSSFRFVHASDTHVSPASVDRMEKMKKIIDSVRPDFVIVTGDLVKDALRVPEKEARSYYDLFQNEISGITAKVWTVPGNHEIFGIERHLSLVSASNPLYGRKMYRHYFGPDYYSFNYGGVHFVALNSLDFEDLWYYGKIDSLQMEWLKRDIGTLTPQTPVVTFQHVPFYSGGLSIQPFEESGPGRVLEREQGILQFRHTVSNAQDVLALMAGHNFPLALAGHFHFQQRFSMAGIPTRFEQTAAIVSPSEEGVLKMPSGLVVYSVTDGKIDEGKFVPLDR